jgi:hypothetical protein
MVAVVALLVLVGGPAWMFRTLGRWRAAVVPLALALLTGGLASALDDPRPYGGDADPAVLALSGLCVYSLAATGVALVAPELAVE